MLYQFRYPVGILLIIRCVAFAGKSLNNNCFINASSDQHSPWFPVLTEGQDFHAWQEYTTSGNASDLAVYWERAPSPLQCSVHSNSTVIVDPHTIRVTITINDTRVDGMCTDEGFYLVTITNNCATNSKIKFHLNFIGKCTFTPPNPAESKMVIVPEPRPNDPNTTFCTPIRYFGSADNNQFDTRWYLGNGACSDHELCADDDGDNGNCERGCFKCNRTSVSNCTFLSNFCIYKYSRLQSGNYTTTACNVFSGSGFGSNISTLDLRILGWPGLTEWPGSTLTSTSDGLGARLTYQLSNYSEFLNLTFYNDSELIANVSTEGYKVEVICDNAKFEMATVRWQVPAEGLYHMCYGFSNVVTPTDCPPNCDFIPNCTEATRVVANKLLVEILAPVAGIFLFLIIVVCIITVYVRTKRLRHKSMQTHTHTGTSEQTRLMEGESKDYGTVETGAPVPALAPSSQTDQPTTGTVEIDAPVPALAPSSRTDQPTTVSAGTAEIDAPVPALAPSSRTDQPTTGTVEIDAPVLVLAPSSRTDQPTTGTVEIDVPVPALAPSSRTDQPTRGTVEIDAPVPAFAPSSRTDQPTTGVAGLKVFLLSPHNPNEYIHILPPAVLKQHAEQPHGDLALLTEYKEEVETKTARMEEEIAEHEVLLRKYEEEVEKNRARMKEEIDEHEGQIARFAACLEASDIIVTGVHQLRDSAVDNIVQWADKQIENSDFVLPIITPSFSKFLNKPPPPGEECLFGATGGYVSRLLNHPPEGVKFLPVFLNQFKDMDLLPIALRGRTLYQISEPFENSLEQFYTVLTNPV